MCELTSVIETRVRLPRDSSSSSLAFCAFFFSSPGTREEESCSICWIQRDYLAGFINITDHHVDCARVFKRRKSCTLHRRVRNSRRRDVAKPSSWVSEFTCCYATSSRAWWVCVREHGNVDAFPPHRYRPWQALRIVAKSTLPDQTWSSRTPVNCIPSQRRDDMKNHRETPMFTLSFCLPVKKRKRKKSPPAPLETGNVTFSVSSS